MACRLNTQDKFRTVEYVNNSNQKGFLGFTSVTYPFVRVLRAFGRNMMTQRFFVQGRGVISKNSAPVGSVYDWPLSFSLSSVFDNNEGLSPFLATNKPGSTHFANCPSPQTGRKPPTSFLYKTRFRTPRDMREVPYRIALFEVIEHIQASY